MTSHTITPKPQRQPGDKKYYSLRSFFSFMRQYKWRFAIVTFFFVIANILLGIIPLFIGKLIGALSAHPMQGHHAVIWVWVLIACSTGHNFLWRFSEVLYMKLIMPLAPLYETILFRETIRKPYPYFVDKFTGKISSYITTIGQEMRQFFDNALYDYVGSFVSLIITGFIFASINWQTGGIFIAGLVLMFITGRYAIRNSAKYEKAAADIQSTKNGKLVDVIANFVNVKSFRKEANEGHTIELEQHKVVASNTRSFIWSIVFWSVMSFFVRDVIWPATIAFNVYLFLHGELSLADLTTVMTAVLLFTASIWDLVWHVSQFNLKLARIDEAHTYLFGPVNIIREIAARREALRQKPVFETALAFNELDFAYPDKPDTAVLDGIKLELKKGEKVGVVGRSGSGKTTLTKLLLGYYPITPGAITVDGVAVDSQDVASIVSYVPQDTSLFHRSIADNIAYAIDRKVSREEIIEAAKQAHAHEFIMQVDGGYDALVGERGVKLSGGQRQRIAIARAMLDDKPILILDEATSALDSESELLVQEGLENLWEHKTVIAIAHRLSTLWHMDSIVVMEAGAVIEQGTHQELLELAGTYAKLWTHQSGGFIDE
ncbi:MAG: transporter related [Candidatus Saccharibacteria bacterium]|nr:transporter related [Candidatus Saccharibacteria bacterium]